MMTDFPQVMVVALENDLFFSVRIADAVRALNGRALIVGDKDALWEAFEEWPDLVLLDLEAPGWEEVVRRAKNLPQTRSIPIVAFGSHVEAEMLRAARKAGCDHAWARSRFMAELPSLLRSILYPVLPAIDGCDEQVPVVLQKGIEQFNHGEYWECHETLEGLWRQEQRPIRALYQGILQVGVAFHHLVRRNYPGAVKMLRRGLPRLRGIPEVCQRVPVAELARAARAVYDRLVELGPDQIQLFDLETLPRIELHYE